MGDENRFKKLEIRPGVRPSDETEISEKSRKERIQELDRKFTLDSSIDHALQQEQDSTETFRKRINAGIIGLIGFCIMFFLASHRILGFDRLMEWTLKVLFLVVIPITFIRWIVSTPK